MITQGTELMEIVVMGSINLAYATICIIIGIAAMVIGYKIFDKLTSFDTAKVLEKEPLAVGVFNGLIALGIGICSGLIIGMSVN